MSSSSVCTNGFDTEGVETFNVQSTAADDFTDRFINTGSIEWMHYNVPRFNNNQQKDMSVLVDGTPQEKEDYGKLKNIFQAALSLSLSLVLAYNLFSVFVVFSYLNQFGD